MNKKALPEYIKSQRPDIICITETKLDERSYNLCPIRLQGYFEYYNFPKHSSGYSGVVVFSKYAAIRVHEDMEEREHSQEGRMLTMEFKQFILINVYMPTSGRFLERLKYR